MLKIVSCLVLLFSSVSCDSAASVSPDINGTVSTTSTINSSTTNSNNSTTTAITTTTVIDVSTASTSVTTDSSTVTTTEINVDTNAWTSTSTHFTTDISIKVTQSEFEKSSAVPRVTSDSSFAATPTAVDATTTTASSTTTTTAISTTASGYHTVADISSTTHATSNSSQSTSETVESTGLTSPAPMHGGPRLGVILPAALVPIGVISIAALLAFVFLKQQPKLKQRRMSERRTTSKPIDILEFGSVFADMNANSQLKFSEEFLSLSSIGKDQSKEAAAHEGNRERNRYTDIKPYDISRVKLSPSPIDESDYINANWIPGYYSRRQYIAAQGPMPSTQDDFWRMVWETGCQVVVMLTKTMENNRVKCCQYWPSGKEVIMYGDIAVSTSNEVESDSWVLRELNVSVGQQVRPVKQCFYTKWPDMKIPDESSSIIEFVRMVRGCSSVRSSSPLVVHCSAGVGRTGAFIALDTAMYQIKEEDKVDIYGIVYKMRLSRVSMVQNEKQYIFIYDAIMQFIENRLEEKKNKKQMLNNGQVDLLFGGMSSGDSVPNESGFHVDPSASALPFIDDDKSLL